MFGVGVFELLFLVLCFGVFAAAVVGVGVAVYFAMKKKRDGE